MRGRHRDTAFLIYFIPILYDSIQLERSLEKKKKKKKEEEKKLKVELMNNMGYKTWKRGWSSCVDQKYRSRCRCIVNTRITCSKR